MAGLKIQNLRKSFGANKVIRGISLDVSDGEFCILLGPSGCGKSTVLKLIAGLEQQDGGKIYIGDREVSDLTPKERDVAMVFQSYALYPHMTVYDNMAFSLKMKKTPKQETEKKVRDAAGLLEIGDLLRRKPKELSGGQRQRVAIGRAIVRDPKLFLFDEPLSNLDAKLRTAMRVELAKLHQKLKATVIYVTHDQTEAMTLGQKIVLLKDGEIQQTGSPTEMYEKPENLFAASFIGSPQINTVDGIVRAAGDKLRFESSSFTVDIADEDLREYSGKEVTMGIRPESLVPGDGPLTCRIEVVERLGSDTIIYASAGDARITSRVPADFEKALNDEITFSIGAKGVHFFHKGNRIGPRTS
jgi:ABC-type sugar transport system ATPase subunit